MGWRERGNMFYCFRQNNSFGKFLRELPKFIIIEAEDSSHAIHRAEELGLYFDGVKRGIDCPCCGDRWSRWDADEEMSTNEPSIYGFNLRTEGEELVAAHVTGEAAVYYLDGTVLAIRLP